MSGVATCKIRHVVTNKTLHLPIVIVSYEQDAAPKWASTEVYGRMDPIFTYQNTVRKFTAILRTPKGGEKFSIAQAKVFKDNDQSGWGEPDAAGMISAPSTVTKAYLGKISDLYKMMYPIYEDAWNRGTGFMTGAPLLELRLEGIAYDGASTGAGSTGGILFAPETFKINSLVDTSQATMTVTSQEDLRFFANMGGYTITLGGTVLHRHNRVGFTVNKGGGIYFGQGTSFPYAIKARDSIFSPTYNPVASPREISIANREQRDAERKARSQQAVDDRALMTGDEVDNALLNRTNADGTFVEGSVDTESLSFMEQEGLRSTPISTDADPARNLRLGAETARRPGPYREDRPGRPGPWK